MSKGIKIERLPIPWAEPIFGSHVCIDNFEAKLMSKIYSKQEAFFRMENNELYPNLFRFHIQQDN